MNELRLLDAPPEGDLVTAYDEANLSTYLRLLDAHSDGASWREIVSVIFTIDPDVEPDRALRIHDSHLARARWMTQTGYRQLIGKADPPA